MPRLLLRLEGMTLLAGAVALYALRGYGWLAFALLLLVPDLAIAAYTLGERRGAIAYNLVHTYALPLALAVLSLVFNQALGLQVALIWLAHVGMDRAMGFGLKYFGAFQDTHFSRV